MLKVSDSSALKRLGDNFASLVVLQGINYLVPLIVFPYLVRVLGIDGFGLYSFVFYVIWIGVVISDYGFDLTATKLISTYNGNSHKINEIFSSVMILKMFLSFLFLGLLTLVILTVDKFSQNYELYYLGFGFVIGQALFPVWFFQGVEKMRYITIINAVSKLVFTLLIFIFVKSIDDLYLVFAFNALGAIIAGIWALYIAFTKFGVSFKLQAISTLIHYFKDGWYVFTSRVAVQLYTSANIIILGFFVDNTVLGYFSIVEKIIRALGGILEPLTGATYPYLNKIYQNSKELFYKRNDQLFFVILIIMMPLAIVINYFGYEILELVSGEGPHEIMIQVLFILSLLLISYQYGSQFTNMLVTLNETKLLNRIVLAAALINLIIAPIAIYFAGIVGLAWLNVFIAFFIAFTKGYFIYFKFRSRDT